MTIEDLFLNIQNFINLFLDNSLTILYLGLMIIIWWVYHSFRHNTHQKSLSILNEAVAAGLTQPASLHPVINPNRCIGCQSCVNICPEQSHKVLGTINGKAELINPTHCIGHGACKSVCPVDAITLVFGTETRGVDIPHVSPNFETNVPGNFIAGELGGMGLIRNAIIQGIEAMESIAKLVKGQTENDLDVVIVGAGPAGIAASLSALEQGLKFKTVEQDSLGGTVFSFPRGKIVMTAPVDLPMIGTVKFKETSKEKLLEFWEHVVEKTGLQISFNERVEAITQNGDSFEIMTNKNTLEARAVLLAIGRRGTPRKLGVPGENQDKVVYRLIDPVQYRGRHVLVVGGGDSALEAAHSIADEQGTTVSLSYRSEAFSRAKQKNRSKIDEYAANNNLNVYMKSTVKCIGEKTVTIEQQGKTLEIENDAIIVCAGGILPNSFLKEIGIKVETKYGTA
jgi:thioredoxin reductase/NAD-dependent dihydropyrimidine dehydrogenase PreA subunit